MSRGGALLLGWLLALAATALFAGFGTWQLGRQHEKQAMLDAAAQVLAERAARPLALAGDAARAREYDWAAGAGAWADAPAVLLDNQQRGGRAGVRAYRLFEPDDGLPLLVELGWLPLPPDRRMPAVAAAPADTRIEGLLLPPPSPGLAAAAVQRQADGRLLVMALEPGAVAAALERAAIAPRVLRPDPAWPHGHARDLEILPNTLPPERHLGYAVQWYGLALAVLAIAVVLTFRRRRTDPARHE